MNAKYFKIILMIFFVSILNAQKHDYFPLQIGNSWIFDRTDANQGIESQEIVDTVEFRNKSYYHFKHTIQTLYENKSVSIYYRKDSLNQVWIKSDTPEGEHIVYKLDAPQGTIWSYQVDNLTSVHTLADTSYTQIIPSIGTIEHCYYFNMTLEEIHTDFKSFLAPEIGLVRRESEGESIILRGAVINDHLLGDTTTTNVQINIDNNGIASDLYIAPNPFNTSTIISYPVRSAKYAKVKLAIYSSIGKEVITLVNKNQIAGEYHIAWDGKNGAGNRLSSGVYFCALYLDGVIYRTQKLLIVN